MSGIAILVIVVLSFSTRIIGSSFQSLTQSTGLSLPGVTGVPVYETRGSSEDADYTDEKAVSLSLRNIAPQPPSPDTSTVGAEAEAFEVTEYSAHIETRNLKDSCESISTLKVREDIIFENANEYSHGCSYTFKVTKESTDEILAFLKSMDPRELSENTYTIQKRIEDFTSQEDILKRKQETIEKTLTDAIYAYDEITRIARQSQNADALASVIDSKVRTIERLTQERINLSTQLDQLARAKAEQLDRLEYTYFNVTIFENKFVDGQELKDSWKMAIKTFVRDINTAIQDMTVGVVALLFLIAQYALYLVIVLLLAKYGWKGVVALWKK